MPQSLHSGPIKIPVGSINNWGESIKRNSGAPHSKPALKVFSGPNAIKQSSAHGCRGKKMTNKRSEVMLTATRDPRPSGGAGVGPSTG
jgi:hypothetical protein